MLASTFLIYPDTGPEFLRYLRIAALYAEDVGVLTRFRAREPLRLVVEVLSSHPDVDADLLERIRNYVGFLATSQDDLDTLWNEGILGMFAESRDQRERLATVSDLLADSILRTNDPKQVNSYLSLYRATGAIRGLGPDPFGDLFEELVSTTPPCLADLTGRLSAIPSLH